MSVPDIDKLLGIEVYATETAGVGGVIRESVDDFRVEEILVDGSKAEIEKAPEKRVLGASPSRQRYLLCVLVKRNWDTFIALKNIGKQLTLSQGQIQIAGIKDAKAVTAQHITVENCAVEDAAKVNVKDINLRPVGYVHEKLSPYYLLGNHFAIKIKAAKHAASTVEKRIAEVAEAVDSAGGVPNFFGHQRFGTTRPITHLVGKAIIERDFEEAAMLFLSKSSVHEHPSSRSARIELQSTRDFKQALHNFPRQLRFERLMLRYLVEKPDDFVGAFMRLPVKLQGLFVQAYQSYLFNRFLSERIKSGFSLNKVEAGDYVVNVERSGLPMVNVAKVVGEEAVAEVNERVEAGKMRVALPLIGIKQKPSQGTMGRIEGDILEEEGIQTGDFRVNEVSRISGRGGLRAVLTPVQGFKLHSVSASSSDQNESQAELSFMLLRGSYATVLLREMIKPENPITAGF
ncbi:tRNA pseudouridine(13) synthase TruD [Candidatus Bathyarchaeota archaeon]|nr:tRNA pseudouridine(13) synthase TruD [Candidatus Bathyarchaeota archaeon]